MAGELRGRGGKRRRSATRSVFCSLTHSHTRTHSHTLAHTLTLSHTLVQSHSFTLPHVPTRSQATDRARTNHTLEPLPCHWSRVLFRRRIGPVPRHADLAHEKQRRDCNEKTKALTAESLHPERATGPVKMFRASSLLTTYWSEYTLSS